MDFNLNDLAAVLADNSIQVFTAVAVLVVGWLVAMIASALVRNVLSRTGLDERLNAIVSDEDGEPTINIANWTSKIVFWVVILWTLSTLFARTGLSSAAEPIDNLVGTVTNYLPGLVGAAALLLVAWIVASILKWLVTRAAEASNIDELLTSQADLGDQPLSVSSSLATIAYWLAFLMFIPGVLAQLQLEGLEETFSGLVDPVVDAIPDLLGAAILLVVGWIAARIARQVVTSVLNAAGVDQLGERIGMSSKRTLSGLGGTLAYAFVLIPFVGEAINQAGINSGPVQGMLDSFLGAIPNLIGGAILLGVAYYVGTIIADLVSSILENVGLNRLPERLGFADGPAEGGRSLSDTAGYITLVGIMLLAAAEAANLMSFDSLNGAIESVIGLGGEVLLAIAILVLGIYLSDIARSVVLSSAGDGSTLLANAARWVTLLIAGGMALGQISAGGEIVQTAFTAVVYGAAVAVALAFGLGGKEAASGMLDSWFGGEDA